MFTKFEDGYIIADSIYIGPGDAPKSAVLTLRTEKWPDVVYDKKSFVIDYPGEYELAGYIVLAWVDWKNQMQYSIRYDQKKIAFIQSAEGLDSDMITDMQTRFVTKESLKDLIAMRELEGTVMLLE